MTVSQQDNAGRQRTDVAPGRAHLALPGAGRRSPYATRRGAPGQAGRAIRSRGQMMSVKPPQPLPICRASGLLYGTPLSRSMLFGYSHSVPSVLRATRSV